MIRGDLNFEISPKHIGEGMYAIIVNTESEDSQTPTLRFFFMTAFLP